MTNREKLTKTNIYDMLCDLNKAMAGFRCDCIMDALTDGKNDYSALCCGSCGECIAKWLSEEAGQ